MLQVDDWIGHLELRELLEADLHQAERQRRVPERAGSLLALAHGVGHELRERLALFVVMRGSLAPIGRIRCAYDESGYACGSGLAYTSSRIAVMYPGEFASCSIRAVVSATATSYWVGSTKYPPALSNFTTGLSLSAR